MRTRLPLRLWAPRRGHTLRLAACHGDGVTQIALYFRCCCCYYYRCCYYYYCYYYYYHFYYYRCSNCYSCYYYRCSY